MTQTRALAAFAALLIAGVIVGLVAMLLDIFDNGPAGPALFNNSNIPAVLTVDGAPSPSVQPEHTRNVGAGAVWVIPPGVSCDWHPGKQGAPHLASNTSVPITGYITIELCLTER